MYYGHFPVVFNHLVQTHLIHIAAVTPGYRTQISAKGLQTSEICRIIPLCRKSFKRQGSCCIVPYLLKLSGSMRKNNTKQDKSNNNNLISLMLKHKALIKLIESLNHALQIRNVLYFRIIGDLGNIMVRAVNRSFLTYENISVWIDDALQLVSSGCSTWIMRGPFFSCITIRVIIEIVAIKMRSTVM